MSLRTLVKKQLDGNTVNYSNTEAIYTETPFDIGKDIRFGQPCFENGGLLDKKEFFCTLESFTDMIDEYTEQDKDDLDYYEWDTADDCPVTVAEIAEYIIEEVERVRV